MAIAVGIDIAKETHWACLKIAETGQLLASHKVDNIPADIADLIDEIGVAAREHGAATVGIDILGGIAALTEAMLLQAGIVMVHVPGLAVNRARRAAVGGEHKSDPKDAAVIADQVRMREDLRPVTAARDLDIDLRLLVGRHSEIVADQTRRAARLRDLLVSIHPGLERVVDVTSKTGLHFLTRYVTPAEIRAAGRRQIMAHLRRAGHLRETTMTSLADAAVAAAQAQRVTVPGETVSAGLIRELASEMLSAREQLKLIDKCTEAILADHPDAALVRSLPGMGATLTAEFFAITGGIDRFASGDQLAAAAGLAPVLKQSGKSRYLQRATAGDKALKRVFYQSAFVAIGCNPASKTYYQRKRTEGKAHRQAVIALARRRVNVLHAILRNRRP
jgi:transposase/transposase IS116/IS110/IS902 family protein